MAEADRAAVRLLKLVVFVPVEHAAVVRRAIGEAGAGRLGKYDHCTFETRGSGRYRPLEGSNPYKGRVGTVEEVEEVRLESVCREGDVPSVLAAMRAAHPYEEVAFDLIPLVNHQFEKGDAP